MDKKPNKYRKHTKPVQLGYDAAQRTAARKSKAIDLQAEHNITTHNEKQRLISNARDLERNFPVAHWAIQRNLDFISTFSFQARTGDPGLDRDIEALMQWWSNPNNCDVAGRHSLDQLIRLCEHGRTVDGDIFINKLSNGRLQLIEADRVHNATLFGANKKLRGKSEEYVHGVRINKNMRALSYVISDRVSNFGQSYEFKAELPAQFVYQLGYFSRPDQVRGISPLSSAITTFQDLNEATKLHLLKMKTQQYFALKFTRDSNEALDNDETERTEPYSFDFGAGPQLLDLDIGEDASFLEGKVGSENDFKSFMDIMTQQVLKSLDIPYSFYNESFTNYSGSRGALVQYERAAKSKRDQLKIMLNNLTAWRLSLFVEDGVLSLPSGTSLSNVKWEWMPAKLPWIDPLKELSAYQVALDLQLDSRSNIAKESGKEWTEIMQQLAQEKKQIEEMLGDTNDNN